MNLQPEVFGFFDALRQYDVDAAMDFLAEGVAYHSSRAGVLHGKDAVKARLEEWLLDPATRPSLTIADVRTGGATARLELSVSGRGGRAPRMLHLDILTVHGKIHQVVWTPA